MSNVQTYLSIIFWLIDWVCITQCSAYLVISWQIWEKDKLYFQTLKIYDFVARRFNYCYERCDMFFWLVITKYIPRGFATELKKYIYFDTLWYITLFDIIIIIIDVKLLFIKTLLQFQSTFYRFQYDSKKKVNVLNFGHILY